MRIVWLKTELLHPVDRGGRIRTYAMLKALRARHEVTYACLDDGGSAPDAAERSVEYAQALVRFPYRAPPRRSLAFLLRVARNLASREPFSAWRYRSAGMRQYLERLQPRDADVVVCDFLFPAVNLPERGQVPTVLFQHNVEAMIWRRLAKTAGSRPARLYYDLQAQRLERFEREACHRFDQVVAVSAEDRDHMRRAYAAPRVDDVPTGVDTEFFQARPGVDTVPGRLVFVGAMDWLPNEDGVKFFLDEIWPKVRQRRADATVTIVGRNPTAELKERATREVGVEVTGTVPDVRPHLQRGAIFIVPLRIGGGTRLKIYEAMSVGLPVVSTTIGAEGLPLVHEQDLLLADGADAFADACVRLLDAPEQARALAARGSTRVRREFGWDAAAARFTALCEAAIHHRGGRPAATPSSPTARESHA